MLIPWLLKYDGYPPGVVVALLLHGILMYIFLPKQFDPAEQVRIEPASFQVASATQSPQRLRRLQQTQQQAAAAERERQQRQRDEQRKRDEAAAAERQRVAEQQRQREAEQQRQREAEQQRVQEQERQRVAQEQERERQREADRQRQAQEQAAAEAARQAAANTQAQSVEQQMVAQYVGIIKQLVSGAWSRPPSARNGMVAVVQLRLTPTGEIISATIVQSSGDGPFDRSVTQALDRVGNFSELQDMPTPIFERYFRNFNLEFRPEDLLR